MAIKFKVYSDSVCPFCYQAKFPLQLAIEGRGLAMPLPNFPYDRALTP